MTVLQSGKKINMAQIKREFMAKMAAQDKKASTFEERFEKMRQKREGTVILHQEAKKRLAEINA